MFRNVELTSAVCEAIETVTFVTNTLEASRIVDADVIARPLEGTLVDVCNGQVVDLTISFIALNCIKEDMPISYRIIRISLRLSMGSFDTQTPQQPLRTE